MGLNMMKKVCIYVYSAFLNSIRHSQLKNFLCYEFSAADSATNSTGGAIKFFFVVFSFLCRKLFVWPDLKILILMCTV